MTGTVHLKPPPPPTRRAVAPPAGGAAAAPSRGAAAAPPARAMAGIWGEDPNRRPPPDDGFGDTGGEPQPSTPRPPATETIGRRAGALSDELAFPQFVASLIEGTWDAMVDASVHQMEAFADLVAAISKPMEQFRDENVSVGQARDWLVSKHSGDVALGSAGGTRVLVPRGEADEFGDGASPDWLRDYGLDGQPLTAELLEEELIPIARERIARDRMQTLATLVMLGMQRIVVRDGSITARLRFRASAAEQSSVDFAVSDEPTTTAPATSWARRGSTTYPAPSVKVSTVGVNAQTDQSLNAELFGEVKINFASETVPLERFVDEARRVLLDRAARPPAPAPRQALPTAAPQPAPAPVALTPTPAQVPTPAPAVTPVPMPGGPA